MMAMADLETRTRHRSPDDENLPDGLEELEAVRRRRRRLFTRALVGIGGLIALVALVIFFPVRDRIGSDGLREGREAIVNRASIVGVDYDAWFEAATLEASDDQIALNELIGTERAFVVNEGARVLIVEARFNSVMVRALNGIHAGREGWLRSGSLRLN